MDPALRDEGDAARDRGDWRQAADAYASHLERYPDDFAIWVQHGHMSKALDDLDRASDSYRRAAELRPQDADLLLQRGHLSKRMGDRAAAAAFYRSSFFVDGNRDAARELVDPAMLRALADAPVPVSVSGRLVGSLDGISAGHIVGWAVDPDHPDEPAEVEILVNGILVTTEHADLIREDVTRSGLASGAAGFRTRLPDLAHTDDTYSVSVRLARTGENLVNSPLTVARSSEVKDWLSRNARLNAEDLERVRGRMDLETTGQLLSIVMPVYNPRAEWLTEALDSVLAQWCTRWELICVDDGSTEAHVGLILADFAARDRRIRVVKARRNGGISKTTNLGIKRAKGQYVAFMDHDDYLEPEAVFRMLDAARTGAELIYSDEMLTGPEIDDITAFVARSAFSHDYYLSHPYFVHFIAVRRDVALAVQGYDETMAISADVDFVLRVIEQATQVAHVPAMVYRWRTHETSAGHASMALVTEATTAAHNRHLARLGSAGESRPGFGFNNYRTHYPDDPEATLIVIPTKDGLEVLKPCIASVLKTTSRENCDILIIDHQSRLVRTKNYFAKIKPTVRVEQYEGDFNFSAINNFAVQNFSEGYKYIVFMNNDVECIEAGWLERMRSLAARPEVGAVGATLLYANGTVQHAGVVVGMHGYAEHSHKAEAHRRGSERQPGYNCSLVSTREYSAVTAACMMLRRETFLGVGGFDEDFAIGFNDTDLCLRIGSLGYRIVNDADAPLYHHESMTRAVTRQIDHPADSKLFTRRWASLLAHGDPFYSPLLSTEHEHKPADLNPLHAPARVRPVRAALRPLDLGRLRKVPSPLLAPCGTPAP